MKVSTRTLIVISAIILLLVVPANLFRPLASSADNFGELWQISATTYYDYLLRFSIIFFGLLLTLVSLIIALVSVFFHKHTGTEKLANLSIFVFVFVIGWMAIPYWTNGLFHVFSIGTSSVYDPKELLPMALIGEVWRIPILVLYPVLLVYLLFSLIRFIVVVVKHKNPGFNNVLILIFNLLIIATYFFTPHYFYWLLD